MKNIFPTEEVILKAMASIKRDHGFRCRKKGCRSKECYQRRDLYRVCKTCKKQESVLANTAFQGLRVPVINVFYELVQKGEEFLENAGAYIDDRKKRKGGRSFFTLNLECMNQPSGWNFFSRLDRWLPKGYENRQRSNFEYIDANWMQGVKPSRTRFQEKVYTLLFDEFGDSEPLVRPVEDILMDLTIKPNPKSF